MLNVGGCGRGWGLDVTRRALAHTAASFARAAALTKVFPSHCHLVEACALLGCQGVTQGFGAVGHLAGVLGGDLKMASHGLRHVREHRHAGKSPGVAHRSVWR